MTSEAQMTCRGIAENSDKQVLPHEVAKLCNCCRRCREHCLCDEVCGNEFTTE